LSIFTTVVQNVLENDAKTTSSPNEQKIKILNRFNSQTEDKIVYRMSRELAVVKYDFWYSEVRITHQARNFLA